MVESKEGWQNEPCCTRHCMTMADGLGPVPTIRPSRRHIGKEARNLQNLFKTPGRLVQEVRGSLVLISTSMGDLNICCLVT